jgi:hypothetical protein
MAVQTEIGHNRSIWGYNLAEQWIYKISGSLDIRMLCPKILQKDGNSYSEQWDYINHSDLSEAFSLMVFNQNTRHGEHAIAHATLTRLMLKHMQTFTPKEDRARDLIQWTTVYDTGHSELYVRGFTHHEGKIVSLKTTDDILSVLTRIHRDIQQIPF